MVHQHFRLVEPFTVAENVVLGDQRGEGGSFRLRARARAQCRRARGALRPLRRPARAIWQLSVGEQQRVEILKALYRDARILILDEPTAVLTPQEARALFETLRAMAADGRTVVFISHKLHEVMAVSDRITVLRGGRVDRDGGDRERDAEGACRADGRPRGRDGRRRASARLPAMSCSSSTTLGGGRPRAAGAERRFAGVRGGEIVGVAGWRATGNASWPRRCRACAG